MKCPYCGAEVQGAFCSYCGSELPKAQSVTNVTDNSHTTIINNYYGYQNPTQDKSPSNATEKNINSTSEPHIQKAPIIDHSLFWTLIWLLFFYPVGIFRMWKKKQFSLSLRIVLTALFILISVYVLGAGGQSSTQPDIPTSQEYNMAVPTPSRTPSPTPREFDSIEDAFKQGFEEGLGDTDDREQIIKESMENIKESTNEILSE